MASSVLSDAVNAITAELTTLGLKPVTDPRNIRPNTVFVELPTATNLTYNVADIRIVLRVVAPPPGNSDAADYLMGIADRIMDSPIAVTDMRPGLLSIGGQDLPSYDLTAAISVRRN